MDQTVSIVLRVERAAESGSLAGLEVEFWDRGGPPGHGYESNQLSMKEDHGVRIQTFLRTRFDATYTPPFCVEEFRRPVEDYTLRPFLRLVARALVSSHSEESPVPIGDTTKITILARVDGAESSKTYYQKLPEDLADLGRLASACMTSLASEKPRILSKSAG
jgi:hypothetical protein